MSKLFLAQFEGLVHTDHNEVQDFPFKRGDLPRKQYEEAKALCTADDIFQFTETALLRARSLKAAQALAGRMVKDWHRCHWCDCAWTVGTITEVNTLEDVAEVLKPVARA